MWLWKSEKKGNVGLEAFDSGERMGLEEVSEWVQI